MDDARTSLIARRHVHASKGRCRSLYGISPTMKEDKEMKKKNVNVIKIGYE